METTLDSVVKSFMPVLVGVFILTIFIGVVAYMGTRTTEKKDTVDPLEREIQLIKETQKKG